MIITLQGRQLVNLLIIKILLMIITLQGRQLVSLLILKILIIRDSLLINYYLIEALQAVLEKLKNKQLPNATKKFGQLPSCDAGEQCAARKGARIGKLCGCPLGTTCDFFIMKCL
uniref:CART prepropeptide n=1 Tax=Astyanax mexicanus TaxID=7994 RepID=A0A8B9L741_ASTMX